MDIALLIWAVALTILVIVGSVWILDLQARLRRMQQRYQTMLAVEGEAGASALLESLAVRLAETTARTERLTVRAEQIDKTLAHTVQGVGLVRFRAFQDAGGEQSFALALADGEGNGAVISMLYRRGETRLYAKPVQGWLSPNQLGDEEQEALAQVKRKVVGHD
jgi:hypothetical protein